MKYIKATAAVGLTAAALLLLLGALSPTPSGYSVSPPPANAIAQIQDRLTRTPGHWPLWAQLGHLYLEQARVTANPAFYNKAEAALKQSIKLNQADNSSALTGLGSLANTRHDFASAVTLAQQALSVNPHHAPAYGVLADAQTQLGRSALASEAVRQMLDLDPSLPALSRAAYDHEQHGRVAESTALWHRALRDAHGTQAAFVHEQLGNLHYHSGNLPAAEASYLQAIASLSPARSAAGSPAAPSAPLIHSPGDVIEPPVDHVLRDVDLASLPVLDAARGVAGWHGLAKVSVALGQISRARQVYALLTSARPDPVLFAEYAALLTGAEREQQLALADAALALLADAGSLDDLATAEVAIARGDFAKAVSLCEREWQRRQHADVADLLGWSLHLAGRDAEAIGFARQALSLGIQHRDYQSHLRVIEESLR
ncbi:tetratricopeptide repeat protein [Catelliglobosispora koreensis]|uniref:tetratricopeptide repeat protein n=1 Tax=Catelliglobosispora koreensis TaxID=129052 RepID=UPI000368E8DF|nr:tetratricopeptide repeat protein [Catelliglobosispora koreensis]